MDSGILNRKLHALVRILHPNMDFFPSRRVMVGITEQIADHFCKQPPVG